MSSPALRSCLRRYNRLEALEQTYVGGIPIPSDFVGNDYA